MEVEDLRHTSCNVLDHLQINPQGPNPRILGEASKEIAEIPAEIFSPK